MRAWMFSSAMSGSVPVERLGEQRRRRPPSASSIGSSMQLDAEVRRRSCAASRLRVLATSRARASTTQVDALGAERVDRDQRDQRRVDPAGEAEHDALEAVLLDVVAQAEAQRRVDLGLGLEQLGASGRRRLAAAGDRRARASWTTGGSATGAAAAGGARRRGGACRAGARAATVARVDVADDQAPPRTAGRARPARRPGRRRRCGRRRPARPGRRRGCRTRPRRGCRARAGPASARARAPLPTW